MIFSPVAGQVYNFIFLCSVAGIFGYKIVDGTVFTTFGAEWNWMHDGKWNYFETTMDGVNYNVYFADYYQPVAANETTEQLICGVYLDKNVDMKDG